MPPTFRARAQDNPNLVEASLSESPSGWTIKRYCRINTDEHDGPVPKYLLFGQPNICLLYTSPSPRDKRQSRMPSSA